MLSEKEKELVEKIKMIQSIESTLTALRSQFDTLQTVSNSPKQRFVKEERKVFRQ